MKRRANKRGGRLSVLMNAVGTLLLAAVIILCVPVTVPRMFGYQIYNVLTGSMEPAIPAGSLIYAENTEPSEIEEGDVIVFYSSVDAGVIITHRVEENHRVSDAGDGQRQNRRGVHDRRSRYFPADRKPLPQIVRSGRENGPIKKINADMYRILYN